MQKKTILQQLLLNQDIVFSLTRRDVETRYKGTFFGTLWSFLNPVMMLTVYTFVFSIVFKARWAGSQGSKLEFALILFTGLIVFNFFAEVVNRSPKLILENINFVKKILFPLEILPLVLVLSSLFHFLVSIVVWFIFYGFFFGIPPVSIIQLPLLMIPLVFMSLGVSWFLAASGVYLRDIGQVASVFTTVFLFLSPVFYSIEALPNEFKALLEINPLTFYVEQARDIMIWSKPLAWRDWFLQIFYSSICMFLGFYWFQKTRKGFADVI